MIKQKFLMLVFGVLSVGMITLTSCSESKSNNDDNPEEEMAPKGKFTLQLTDSPIDDERVKGVYVTIKGIEVDNESFLFESPKTIEISALTQGKTMTIFDQEIEAKEYQEVSLLLRLDQNTEGNGPGSYLVTMDDATHNLSTSENTELKIPIDNSMMKIEDGGEYAATLDFDLRKAITYNAIDETDLFDFRQDLNLALRWVDEEAFSVQGKVNDPKGLSSDLVVVYAFAKNTFDDLVEKSPDEVFVEAVSSAALDDEGNYNIYFLEGGEYELKLATFKKSETGKLMYDSLLEVEIIEGTDLNNTTLNANATVDLNITEKVEI